MNKPAEIREIKRVLQLAAVAPLRFYKNGWFSTLEMLGEDQFRPVCNEASICTSQEVLKTMEMTGLLVCEDNSKSCEMVAHVYARRWCITDAGRELLVTSTD